MSSQGESSENGSGRTSSPAVSTVASDVGAPVELNERAFIGSRDNLRRIRLKTAALLLILCATARPSEAPRRPARLGRTPPWMVVAPPADESRAPQKEVIEP
jgi:hypothetical protein